MVRYAECALKRKMHANSFARALTPTTQHSMQLNCIGWFPYSLNDLNYSVSHFAWMRKKSTHNATKHFLCLNICWPVSVAVVAYKIAQKHDSCFDHSSLSNMQVVPHEWPIAVKNNIIILDYCSLLVLCGYILNDVIIDYVIMLGLAFSLIHSHVISCYL